MRQNLLYKEENGGWKEENKREKNGCGAKARGVKKMGKTI